IELGENTEAGGKFAFQSLEAATTALQKGEVDVLVTAPINKQNIQSADFQFPGHTEYLAQKGDGEALMLMLSERMRIGVVTGHIPLDQVAEAISQEKVLEKLRLFNQSLKQDFGIRKPKIAVLGLNPHAGDAGVLGKEEDNTIKPALKIAISNQPNFRLNASRTTSQDWSSVTSHTKTVILSG
ncbi:MAG: 4-hydroxythreonine-4-phosphate dehydrogenase PdxA, partial [Pseudomonadales bacterium]|nr:4-hydroxythreonine-4-phosphate dehydrogenase PdxA [Pseudomonadales bacterium]